MPTSVVKVLTIEYLVALSDVEPFYLSCFSPTAGLDTAYCTCHCIGKYRNDFLVAKVWSRSRSRHKLSLCSYYDRLCLVIYLIISNYIEVVVCARSQSVDNDRRSSTAGSSTGSQLYVAVHYLEADSTTVVLCLSRNADRVEAFGYLACTYVGRSLGIYIRSFAIEVSVSHPESQVRSIVNLHLIDIAPVSNACIFRQVNINAIPLLPNKSLGDTLLVTAPNRYETNGSVILNPNIVVQFFHQEAVETETICTEVAITVGHILTTELIFCSYSTATPILVVIVSTVGRRVHCLYQCSIPCRSRASSLRSGIVSSGSYSYRLAILRLIAEEIHSRDNKCIIRTSGQTGYGNITSLCSKISVKAITCIYYVVVSDALIIGSSHCDNGLSIGIAYQACTRHNRSLGIYRCDTRSINAEFTQTDTYA